LKYSPLLAIQEYHKANSDRLALKFVANSEECIAAFSLLVFFAKLPKSKQRCEPPKTKSLMISMLALTPDHEAQRRQLRGFW
jgi:hypothetical protein